LQAPYHVLNNGAILTTILTEIKRNFVRGAWKEIFMVNIANNIANRGVGDFENSEKH